MTEQLEMRTKDLSPEKIRMLKKTLPELRDGNGGSNTPHVLRCSQAGAVGSRDLESEGEMLVHRIR